MAFLGALELPAVKRAALAVGLQAVGDQRAGQVATGRPSLAAALVTSALLLVAVEQVEERPPHLPELDFDLRGGKTVQGLLLQAVDGDLPQFFVAGELLAGGDVTFELVPIHIPGRRHDDRKGVTMRVGVRLLQQ